MRWKEYSNQYETIREAESIVSDVVVDFRNRGHQTEHAIEQTALALGTTKRRVKALFYGEAGAIARDLLETLRHRFLTHLDDEAEHAMKRAADRTARRKAMEQERVQLRGMRR